MQQAAEWVYTGRVFNAEEALRRPAGAQRPPPGRAAAGGATRSPAEIAENTAPVSVALSRQMMWRMLGADHPMDAHRADSRGILVRGRSAELAEGVNSLPREAAGGVPDRVSDGLPDLFPDWEDPEFA